MGKCEFCGQVLPKKNILKSLTQFLEAIERQFQYGGEKYAQTETKEATDVLFDDFGKDWLLGTIAKYCKRYSNVARERDLLKIACYMFIIWLKRGFHIKEKGTYKVIDTTVKAKKEYFPIFIERVNKYIDENIVINVDNPIDKIYQELKYCSDSIFCLIEENRFFKIFQLAYYIWNKDIKEKGKDEDVYNESKLEEKIK